MEEDDEDNEEDEGEEAGAAAHHQAHAVPQGMPGPTPCNNTYSMHTVDVNLQYVCSIFYILMSIFGYTLNLIRWQIRVCNFLHIMRINAATAPIVANNIKGEDISMYKYRTLPNYTPIYLLKLFTYFENLFNRLFMTTKKCINLKFRFLSFLTTCHG
jgi:hypothetical protein